MLKQLTPRNYNFVNKDNPFILRRTARVFTSHGRVARDNNYYWEVNRKRMNFSVQLDYKRNDCNESMNLNKNNDPYKSIEKWNVFGYFLFVVGVTGYLLVNNKGSAVAEEDENIIDVNDLQLETKKLDELSIKLMEGLPMPAENYVDLQGKKELLDQKLKSQDIVVISGAGGMGKSTLVAQYGHEPQQRGDMQVIWVKGTQIEEEFFRLAALLRIETSGLNNELIRNLVYGNLQMLFDRKFLLIIFDNVETKEKIEEYLINLPNTSKVIITTRNGNLLDGIKPIRLKGFNREEAVFYLGQALKISEEEAKQITNVVGESPFRLSIVAAYIKNYALSNVDELTKKYLQIKRGKFANEEIYPEVKMLFRNLKKDSPKAWELLKYLAYMDAEGVSVPLIGKIMNQTVSELEEAINKMIELSLVKANEKKVRVTHRIIQEEIRKAIGEEDKEQEEEARILGKLVCELNKKLPYIDDQSNELEEVSELARHGKEVIKVGNFKIENIEDLLEKIGDYYLYRVFNYKEAINCWEKALNRRKYIHTSQHADVARSLDHLGIAYRNLGGKENILKCLKYQKEGLKMRQGLYPGNHPDTATSLNNIGYIYGELGGEENLHKGLKYKKDALKMRKALFSGNHPDTATSLNSIGWTYSELRGEENLRKALKYKECALNMQQALFLGNHPDTARSLNNVGWTYSELGGEENLRKGLKYKEDALNMQQALFPGNHPDTARSLNNVGWTYTKLEGEENVGKGLKYKEDALNMYQALFPGNHPKTAASLNNIGMTYRKLGGEKNLRKELNYLENALNMQQALFPGNNSWVASSLYNLGISYQTLGDENKALEYMKQAYSIYLNLFDENHEKIRNAKTKIELLQPNFFINQYDITLKYQDCLGGNKVGSECRWMITERGDSKEDLIRLKQKIQKNVLSNLVKAVEEIGWSKVNWRWVDEGVKGYLEESYLKKEVGTGDSNQIKMAKMLCFESINLGIMKSEEKPYGVVQEFTKNNLELVKEIAKEHPEFFVDGSIAEACIKAMPSDEAFQKHILKHIRYMGVEARMEMVLENQKNQKFTNIEVDYKNVKATNS